MGDIHDRTFSARLDCHYFLLEPDVVDSQTPLVVTLHGFGANTGAMLQPTARLFERHPVIAGLQGPNQFFLGAGNREVGYRWINNSRPAESIRLHHEMLLHVTDEAGGEFDIPPERRLLVGFSQSVGLNYRFVATHPGAVRGVIGICDGLPGDWDDGAYQPVTAAVLHIARGGDVEKAERYDHGKRRQASAKTEADKGQTVRCSVEEECQQASNYHRETRGVGYWQHAVWYDPAMILSRSIRPVSTDLKQENSSLTRRLPMARKHTKTLMTEKDGIRGLVPARNRGYRDRVFAEYLDTLNPRANVVMQNALAVSPDVRFQEFLDRVMTPKYLRASLATIAKGCGINLLEFNQWWGKASAQRAIAEAQLASPGVVEDLIEDAKSKDAVCDRCDGIGSVAAPPDLEGDMPGYRLAREASEEHGAIYTRTCPKCAGKGTVRRSGDAHARDRLMEIAGLSSGAKGAAVVIQNFSGASHASAVPILEDAMSILDVKAERLAEDEAIDETD